MSGDFDVNIIILEVTRIPITVKMIGKLFQLGISKVVVGK